MMRLSLLLAVVCGLALSAGAEEPPVVDFNRDVRPILADHCLKCHGPGQPQRQAGLRVDTKDGLFEPLESGKTAVVPGNSAKSELYRRLISADADEKMPPSDAGVGLTAKEIETIRRWIDSGGKWERHWAYQTPRRPALPKVKDADWPKTPIDYFILARLQREALSPSPPADRASWLRRVTYDLTALPPTPKEIDVFLADKSPQAYEKVVDRLLASPRFGERMALHWLDLARYADTHGYHMDSHRDMWRWRDWVIRAFNDNMPFDRFTIEQLAGDLLPNATLEQKIATGFNRNHMINFENGAIPAEYRSEYVIDRVITTSTVWLAQTMRCARCHEHKYDSFTQRDFYRLYAYFNNIPEQGLDGRKGNAVPFIKAPTRKQREELASLDSQMASLNNAMQMRAKKSADDQLAWEKRLREGAAKRPEPPTDMLLYYPLDKADENVIVDRSANKKHGKLHGEAILVPGKFGDSLLFNEETYVEVDDTGGLERDEKFSLGAWVYSTTNDEMTILARNDKSAEGRGYLLGLRDGKVVVRLTYQDGKNAIAASTKSSLPQYKWRHVMIGYDGASKAAGLKIYVDGREQELIVERDDLRDTIKTTRPLRIGRGDDGQPFRGMIDDVRFYRRQLSATEMALLAGSNPIQQIVNLKPNRRTDEQVAVLNRYFLEHEDSKYRVLHGKFTELHRQRDQFNDRLPTTMVMQEMDTPRETFILRRGDYRHKTEKVTSGVPINLLSLPANAPANRLGLAQWLVDPRHPLTARVTVNRFWLMLFGRGLVETADDFGTRGTWPSHPELLDWLSREFVDGGWDVKQMLKLMVLSSTYRQSSRTTPELSRRDPQNRLLARAPRLRLSAEMIRDSALFASGLLHEKVGGPSVFPYHPSGLWKEVSYNPSEFTAQVYKQSTGTDLYRRSLYTFWKRSVPPPALEAFGAPNRETCTVRRQHSNTPQQALVRMNDPTYVEAARVLAERMMTKETTLRDRITFAFRHVVSRQPRQAELNVLAKIYRRQLAHYQNNRNEAVKLLSVGQSMRSEKLDLAEHAAWTIVASTILNLDEAITKN